MNTANKIFDQLKYILSWASSTPIGLCAPVKERFESFTPEEISIFYTYISKYVKKGIKLSHDTELYKQIQAIESKYSGC